MTAIEAQALANLRDDVARGMADPDELYEAEEAIREREGERMLDAYESMGYEL